MSRDLYAAVLRLSLAAQSATRGQMIGFISLKEVCMEVSLLVNSQRIFNSVPKAKAFRQAYIVKHWGSIGVDVQITQ